MLLTVSEVAEGLRVSTITVYRLIKKGEIKAVRIGHSLRVDEETLKARLSGEN